ncbi:MAG: dipeptide epimerase [bacterium]
MLLKFRPITLELKDTFTISNFSRQSTPAVLTKITFEGITGYGEASLPPYLGESHESVVAFLSKLDFSQFNNPCDISSIMEYVDSVDSNNNAAKTSIDIALHDLAGKIQNKPVYEMMGLAQPKNLFTSITFGIDDLKNIQEKVKNYESFKILKIKLGSHYDKEIINSIRAVTDKPIYVDVNRGWKDKIFACEMIDWLAKRGVVLIEQPMPINMMEETAYLSERSRIPIIADEAVKRLSDLEKVQGIYSGINIKLMKSTGLLEGLRMCNKAKSLGLKIMIGCMTETSCGISAAAQLTQFADYIDLDGNLLIKNDPFIGIKANNGEIKLNYKPGIGVEENNSELLNFD